MIPASRRFAWPVALLGALAALPIWLHALRDPGVETCPGVEAFLSAERIGGGAVTGREGRREGKRNKPAYVEGELETSPGIALLRFRVLRGVETQEFLDPDVLFDFSGEHFRLVPETLERVDIGDAVLPVHWGLDDMDPKLSRVRAHLLVRGSRPVRSPFDMRLTEAAAQLFEGTQPYTRFIVLGVGRPRAVERMREEALAWLGSAWKQYEQACGSRAR